MTLKDIATAALDEVSGIAEDASVFSGIKSEFGKQHVRKQRPSESKTKSLSEHDRRFHPDGYKDGDKCELREGRANGEKSDIFQSGKSVSDRVEVAVCDITKEKSDAIVNAANRWMLGGGGVDGAIHRAAGPGLVEECRKYEPDENGYRLKTGEAKMTKGCDLPAKNVIHTAGPDCRDPEMADEGVRDKALASSYRNSLEIAKENGLKSVSFPSISTGIFGFPLERAAKIAANEIVDFLSENKDMSVKMCVFDPHGSEAIKKAYEDAFSDAAVLTKVTSESNDAMDENANPPMTDLQKHDAKFHGGHYDGDGECKFRDGLAKNDKEDLISDNKGKAYGLLKQLARPAEPPPFAGLTASDISYLEESAKNLAFLAQRVCRNIEKGSPSPGSQALQGYKDTDENRLANMAKKDTTGQAKVIHELFLAAKKSEANGWADKIEVPGYSYNGTAYDKEDPSASTGYASWKPDPKKFPKDPHAAARLAYQTWTPPGEKRTLGVSLAKAILKDKAASKAEVKAANELIDNDQKMTDIEYGISGLISAYENEKDANTKTQLEDLLETVVSGTESLSGYSEYSKRYGSALKDVMEYQSKQQLMGDGETVDDIAAKMKAKGMYVPPLMQTAWNKLTKLAKQAATKWGSAISRISGGQSQAEKNFKANMKALWDSDDIDVLVNADPMTVVSWLSDPAKGGRIGRYEASKTDGDYVDLGRYNFDANYANAREQHKYCGIFEKGSKGCQGYGHVEVVLNRKKVVGFISGSHSCTRGSGHNGNICFLPQNATLSGYWDSSLISKDMSKDPHAGKKILGCFGSTPEFWAVGDLTRDMIDRVRFDSSHAADVILKDADIVKFMKANGIKVEVLGKGEVAF